MCFKLNLGWIKGFFDKKKTFGLLGTVILVRL